MYTLWAADAPAKGGVITATNATAQTPADLAHAPTHGGTRVRSAVRRLARPSTVRTRVAGEIIRIPRKHVFKKDFFPEARPVPPARSRGSFATPARETATLTTIVLAAFAVARTTAAIGRTAAKEKTVAISKYCP